MNKASLVISLVSLCLASVAYWRSGGKQDVQALGREVEALRAKQKELAESVAQSVAAAYERSRKRLQVAREQLRQLKDEAVEGLEQHVKQAQEQVEALAQGVEAGAK